ncbi:hypothetical protein [Phytomonospora endophytica]|uniref:hypothetical protein n=1 Tax=Phytomonospora endophytica TaxID=714109 RepID=UPI001C84C598|nr:hypothetical protein [Phytomonospora endophytica]
MGRAQAAWSQVTAGRVRPSAPLIAAAAGVGVALPTDVPLLRILGVLVAVVALVRLAVPRKVRIEMDLYSVRVRYGMLPGVVRLPLRMITETRVVDVARFDWFGAGRRILPRGTALLARTGPAVEFALVSGRVLVVSLDEPERAREAFERIRARHLGARDQSGQ